MLLVSRPYQSSSKELFKSNMQYITVMKCTTTHKSSASEKNYLFSLCPYTSTLPPQNSGTPSLRYLCLWNEQELGNLLLKRN